MFCLYCFCFFWCFCCSFYTLSLFWGPFWLMFQAFFDDYFLYFYASAKGLIYTARLIVWNSFSLIASFLHLKYVFKRISCVQIYNKKDQTWRRRNPHWYQVLLTGELLFYGFLYFSLQNSSTFLSVCQKLTHAQKKKKESRISSSLDLFNSGLFHALNKAVEPSSPKIYLPSPEWHL